MIAMHSKWRLAGVGLFIFLLVSSYGRAAQGASSALATTYASLKQSLALVAYKDGKDFITGSSFCINSSGGWSYFLTNAHVVGSREAVTMFLSASPGKVYDGTVIRTNPDVDAAIVAVHATSVPSVTIASDTLPEGQSIAIAGYPSAHIDFALLGLGLTPSVHEGIVTSYPASGAFLEFDAQIEHGNSGGPVFDPDTGVVYGVVTMKVGSDQTNLAVTIAQLRTFIQNAQVTVNQATREVALKRVATEVHTPTSEISASTPKLEHNAFNTYIPLRNQDQFYDCGSGIKMVMNIRAYDLNGNYKVTETFTGLSQPVGPFSSLQAHDEYDNIMLVGYLATDGSVQSVTPPKLAIPIKPYDGLSIEMPSGNSSNTRTWVGSLMLGLSSGTYSSELYADRINGGGTFVTAYADHIGLVAVLLFDKDYKPLIGCSLNSITSAIGGTESLEHSNAVVSTALNSTVWVSLASGHHYKVHVEGDNLYAEWLDVPDSQKIAGAFAAFDLRRQDQKWVGKARGYVPGRNGGGCSFEYDSEITSVTETRIEGRTKSSVIYQNCYQSDWAWRTFTWVPQQ